MIKLIRSHHSEDKSKNSALDSLLPLEYLQEILKLFPIGQCIQHFWEYHNEEAENTVVLAYCINKQFIYSMSDISLEEDQFILMGDLDNPVKLSDIEHFYLIVPYVEHHQLEYSRNRTHLVDVPINNYSLGNSITLLSPSTELRCEPQLDSTVIRIMTLREGIYANNKVVALEPLIDGLEHVDRRTFQRVETDIEIEAAARKSKDFVDGRLVDYCETTARLQFDDDGFLSNYHVGDEFKLQFQAYQSNQYFILLAEIQKLRATECVVVLTGIRKGRRFEELENVDLLAIKASLLQHPKTKPLH